MAQRTSSRPPLGPGKRFRSTWGGPALVLTAAFIAGWAVLKVEVRGTGLPRFAGLAVAVLAWVLAWRQLRLKWTIEDTPTVAVKAAFVGRCEVKGKLTSTGCITSHFTNMPSTWCSWKVEEYRQSSNGGSWQTVEHGDDVAPNSYVYDDTGSIWVDLADAEVHAKETHSEVVPGSRPKRRHVERALFDNTSVYVLGDARMLDNAPALQITATDDTPFLVSDRTEAQEERRSRVRQWAMALTGLAFGVAGVMLRITGASGTGKGRGNTFALDSAGRWIALCVAAGYLGAFVVGYIVWQYNRLVEVRTRAEQAWSLIDVQLTRRATLIPQLIETVRGYATYERDVQEALTFQRSSSRLPTAQSVDDASRVAGMQRQASTELLAIGEQYPDLKASENFLALQRSLVDTEDRIALARRFYNDSVVTWRDRSRVFPWSLFAGFVHGPALEFFAGDPGDEIPVRVA